jgi:hypothetical protein
MLAHEGQPELSYTQRIWVVQRQCHSLSDIAAAAEPMAIILQPLPNITMLAALHAALSDLALLCRVVASLQTWCSCRMACCSLGWTRVG